MHSEDQRPFCSRRVPPVWGPQQTNAGACPPAHLPLSILQEWAGGTGEAMGMSLSNALFTRTLRTLPSI